MTSDFNGGGSIDFILNWVSFNKMQILALWLYRRENKFWDTYNILKIHVNHSKHAWLSYCTTLVWKPKMELWQVLAVKFHNYLMKFAI